MKGKGRRFVGWMAAAGLAMGCLVVSAAATVAPSPERGRVVWVGDGDTITVRIGSLKEKVRLLGIDAPELHDEREAWRELAERARDFARSALQGKTVTLEGDRLADDRDEYGRLLRYVVLSDGSIFNDTMVRQGYARAYKRFPLSRAGALREAEAAAKRERLGYWRLPPGPPRVVR